MVPKWPHGWITIFVILSVATTANNSLAQGFSDFCIPQNSPEVLLKHRLLGTTPRVSDSVSLEEGQIAGISNKFSGDAYGAGLGPTFWEPQGWYFYIFL